MLNRYLSHEYLSLISVNILKKYLKTNYVWDMNQFCQSLVSLMDAHRNNSELTEYLAPVSWICAVKVTFTTKMTNHLVEQFVNDNEWCSFLSHLQLPNGHAWLRTLESKNDVTQFWPVLLLASVSQKQLANQELVCFCTVVADNMLNSVQKMTGSFLSLSELCESTGEIWELR